jgi:hypothetical protein
MHVKALLTDVPTLRQKDPGSYLVHSRSPLWPSAPYYEALMVWQDPLLLSLVNALLTPCGNFEHGLRAGAKSRS